MGVTSKRTPAFDIFGWASASFAALAGVCALNVESGVVGLRDLPAACVCTLLAAVAIALGAWAGRRARKRDEAMSQPAIYGLVFGILALGASQFVMAGRLFWKLILG